MLWELYCLLKYSTVLLKHHKFSTKYSQKKSKSSPANKRYGVSHTTALVQIIVIEIFIQGPRIILCMHPANERLCYIVTSSPIGWAHTQNDPWGSHSWEKLPIYHSDSGWYKANVIMHDENENIMHATLNKEHRFLKHIISYIYLSSISMLKWWHGMLSTLFAISILSNTKKFIKLTTSDKSISSNEEYFMDQ